jgi:hypothetical protein
MNFDAAMVRMSPRLRDVCGTAAVIHRRTGEPDETAVIGVQALDGDDVTDSGGRWTRRRALATIVAGDLSHTLDTRSRFVVDGLEYDVTALSFDRDCVVATLERAERSLVGDLNR